MDVRKIKIGDLVKIKVGTRWGWVRGWRKVRGIGEDNVKIFSNGCRDFMVFDHEILDHKEGV